MYHTPVRCFPAICLLLLAYSARLSAASSYPETEATRAEFESVCQRLRQGDFYSFGRPIVEFIRLGDLDCAIAELGGDYPYDGYRNALWENPGNQGKWPMPIRSTGLEAPASRTHEHHGDKP